ncbi:hypothetical protein M407DRAFT_227934 [Tulasnella calospora MUT 4182]|uniref:Calcineurin-like phosphoesterase domain-containing protein n=1 Tax=Tulasnella calospora MUT 4182 TaxID=1051891 RepID=A0A0C3L6F8_9AGAM|nr:hypothetical protein M407DRAFT_227934 [Tulasnella calospora MUT 4182]
MDYDIDFPPPKPGPEWTRFICISDTHGGRFRVPEGDVLLHAGDLTRRGKLSELRSTDHAAALNLLTSSQARASNIHYLNCETFQIPSADGRKSWKVYGSPWTPWFRGLSFNYKEDMAQEIVGSIPPDADIVMTHGPPHGVLDLTRKEGVHAGCPTLLSRIAELKPRLHVFGHIHESRWSRVQQWENQDNLSRLAADLPLPSTVFLNAANSPVTSNFGPEASSADGQRIPIGGPGWHPIIVDML